MSFGSSSKSQGYNPALTKPPFTPTAANSNVLLAGLAGLRPTTNPALSVNFASGSSSGLGRRPDLAKRVSLGGN